MGSTSSQLQRPWAQSAIADLAGEAAIQTERLAEGLCSCVKSTAKFNSKRTYALKER